MMKYGAESPVEHRFTLSLVEVERRGPWIDMFVAMHPREGNEWPDDLEDPSLLLICNTAGELVQIVLQNEGCDCEYQLTYSEKAQAEQFFANHRAALLVYLT